MTRNTWSASSPMAVWEPVDVRALENPPAPQTLDELLAAAFPPDPEDATGTPSAHESDSPVDGEFPDDRLLAIIPAPKPLHFEELEEEVSRHRRLVVRGDAGIPITALIAIGGALLVHALLVGIVFLGIYLSLHEMAQGITGRMADEGGGTGAGYMVTAGSTATLDDPAQELQKATVGHRENSTLRAMPPSPQFSKVPSFSEPRPQDTVSLLNGPTADPGIIGIPAEDAQFGRLKVAPPASKPAVAAAPPQVLATPPAILVPPSSNSSSGNVVAMGNSTGGGAQGSVSAGSDDDDAPISWAKSGTGDGGGSGNKTGRGYMSGANRDQPSVLDAPLPKNMPVGFALEPLKKEMRFRVLVHADGTIGRIDITASCGRPEIDAFFQEYIREHWKFQPAFINGKFIDMTTDVTLGGLAQ